MLDFLDDAMADGRIRHPGFSFHDSLPLFKEIVDAYDWMFTQIQYNYMDEQYQAGTKGLEYAAHRGLGIVIMEPLRGGLLARETPMIRNVFDTALIQRSNAAWGLSLDLGSSRSNGLSLRDVDDGSGQRKSHR